MRLFRGKYRCWTKEEKNQKSNAIFPCYNTIACCVILLWDCELWTFSCRLRCEHRNCAQLHKLMNIVCVRNSLCSIWRLLNSIWVFNARNCSNNFQNILKLKMVIHFGIFIRQTLPIIDQTNWYTSVLLYQSTVLKRIYQHEISII